MAVHLHLLVVAFILLVPTPQQAQGNVSRLSPMDNLSPQIVTINFNVVTDDYKNFLGKLHGVLANNPTRRNVKGVPVLAKQRVHRVPARWIHVNFIGRDATVDKTTIAIRDDNIYLVGFTNITGSWFEFTGRAHLLPDSTLLPFAGDYGPLVGGHKKLKDIKLGKEYTLQAVRMLALHHPNPDESYKRRLREALAKLCVMVAEAERFVPINVTLVQGWKGTPQITISQADYVVLWGKMSYALLMWQKTSRWQDEGNELRQKAGINGPNEALSKLGLLLWPTKFKKFSFDAITADDDGKALADDSSTTCNGTSCN